jgi:hypothetical protein
MRLLSVVSFHGASKMEVTVEDDQGSRRRVTYAWAAKFPTDTPPEGWLSSVQAEVEYQRGSENDELIGRKLVTY